MTCAQGWTKEGRLRCHALWFAEAVTFLRFDAAPLGARTQRSKLKTMISLQLALQNPPERGIGTLRSRTCLFDLAIGLVEDVRAAGGLNESDGEAFSAEFQVALPYRGLFVWHVGHDEVVGDANQALFVTGGERYRMSHPVAGGYAELIVTPAAPIVAELGHESAGALASHALFRRRSRRVSPSLQSLRAQLLIRALGASKDDALAAEEHVLALLRSALDNDAPRQNPGRSTQKLIARTKAYLQAELAHPIRLADVGSAIGASPVYLTQLFRAVEGIPLHRYLTQLRLARALVELPHANDLTQLALELGFSSHSHFSARFHAVFGTTPSQFREQSCRWMRSPHGVTTGTNAVLPNAAP
jgi:AraC family transcriptional regulator